MKKLIALCMAAALCLSVLSACGPKPAEEKKADLAAFAQSVQEKHEFSSLEKADPADEEFGVIMLENAYPGLKDLDLEQVEVYLAMVSFSGGELAVVQAKDADGAAKVKEIFRPASPPRAPTAPATTPRRWRCGSAARRWRITAITSCW